VCQIAFHTRGALPALRKVVVGLANAGDKTGCDKHKGVYRASEGKFNFWVRMKRRRERIVDGIEVWDDAQNVLMLFFAQFSFSLLPLQLLLFFVVLQGLRVARLGRYGVWSLVGSARLAG
jgi:hypothetical protein